ncbi:MAG: CCA tRNA nucleotidyltransferase [Boseongicola sp.]|nr:CCA tRNA nucleotidyltransferase [Boseongicola sp.]MDD9978495.1 CCA tRNA nucleotidyltransferase [Boseongicola sp.]
MTRIEADWLKSEPTQAILSMLSDAGHQAFAVGGCVRNALLDVPVGDIDISTSATPEQVTGLADELGFRAVPTGIEHGTVTVVAHGVPFEITTFRRDVETDGRRAVVSFTDDIREDARRRDFTMNALYVDAAGQLNDPLGGLPDIVARRVVFIENAEDRIREDYLRSLRFFRFHAIYGDPVAGLDADALSAIASNLDGLEQLAKERIGAEMLKLLAAVDPAPSLASMEHAGVMAKVLPGADTWLVGPLVHIEQAFCAKPNSIRRLAALGGEAPEKMLRLSRSQTKALEITKRHLVSDKCPGALGYELGEEQAISVCLLRGALSNQELAEGVRAEIRKGAGAHFPISAEDLMPDLTGPALGDALKALEARWVESDFTLSREDLLNSL